jgi:GNAT superfamily N-acetyltransferase
LCPHPTGDLLVRPFEWADWPALWAVRHAQLGEYGIELDPATIPPGPQADTENDPEWDFHCIEDVYLSGAGNFWLGWDRGHPVGYVGGQDVGGAIELRRMYVQAACRRRGVGTALVQALMAHSHARGVSAIELWTAADGPGRRLYETLGFRTIRVPGPEFEEVATRTRYSPAANEIRMRLEWLNSVSPLAGVQASACK